MILATAFINSNFILLFCAMLFYWLQATTLVSNRWCFIPQTFMLMSCSCQISFLIFRSQTSHHVALSNLYESLIFLSFILTLLVVIFSSFAHFKWFSNINNRVRVLFGAIFAPFILLINTFATFGLPSELQTTSALVPALQSNWLLMHVTVILLSYAALFSGCLIAIAYLIIEFSFLLAKQSTPMDSRKYFTFVPFSFFSLFPFFPQKAKAEASAISFETKEARLITETPTFMSNVGAAKPQLNSSYINRNPSITTSEPLIKTRTEDLLTKTQHNLLNNIDNLSYRLLGLGFALLTVGILSGAVWANQTWGSYWSWDPKETWALITWFIFGIYLHTRLFKAWTGRKSAWLSSFGFLVIWFCYLGVNLMGKGLHSYGFFN